MSDEFYDAQSDDEQFNSNDDDDMRSVSDEPKINFVESIDQTQNDLLLQNHYGSEFHLYHCASLKYTTDSNSCSNNRSISNFGPKYYRKKIPPRPEAKLNLWSIIKNAIGKDLTKIPMPVNFNEPISLLQRVTESCQCSSLLDEAVSINDNTLLQLVYIAAFNVSSYASNAFRTTKPFNPLLNETFEMDRTHDLGWRSICEQVTHHPPACTLYVEGRGWNYTENFNAKSKFRGKYLTVDMLGLAHLHIDNSKHDITWNKVTCSVNNIIIGTLSIDQIGTSEIVNHTTGDVCKLTFHSHSMFNKSCKRKVTGTVSDKRGNVHYYIDGKWDEGIRFAQVIKKTGDNTFETKKMIPIWTIEQPSAEAECMYNFSEFACSLNDFEKRAAPTDSRYRQDQRVMENGDFNQANHIKSQLEQAQRKRRNSAINKLKEGGGALPDHCDEAIEPVWFVVDVNSQFKAPATLYKYKGGYWEHRLTSDWSMCPDIFTIPSESED